MSEKPETEEFDDDESEEVVEGPEDLDIDNLIEKFDKPKRGAVKAEEPAWRRLERYREERNTADLLSDLEDYEIGDDLDSPRKRKKPSVKIP